MSVQNSVAAMTDEELRASGISQEWRSGLPSPGWPYFDSAGRKVDPESPAPVDRPIEK